MVYNDSRLQYALVEDIIFKNTRLLRSAWNKTSTEVIWYLIVINAFERNSFLQHNTYFGSGNQIEKIAYPNWLSFLWETV